MKRLLLGLALVFSVVGGALAETPEQKGGQLSAIDSLTATVGLSGGVLDVGDYAIDIRGMDIPSGLLKYWEYMRIADAQFGINKKSGEEIYIITLAPFDGVLEMPKEAKAVYRLKLTTETDKKSGKPIHRVGELLDFYADGKVVDKTAEPPKGLAPKPNDRCTLKEPCDEMKRQAPCPHHDKGKCEHMEQLEKDKKKKDRGTAI